MRKINSEIISQVSSILKVISHPQRLNILLVLEQKESLSVAELQEELDLEQSLLSHHLIKLKKEKVLTSKKDGRKIIYKLNDPKILSIFDCLENCSIVEVSEP